MTAPPSELIAEIGQNHNGDMTLARALIRAAKDNGADVAKFQVFHAPSLFARVGNPWYDYNCRTELSRDQVLMLAEDCQRVGIEFFASVFDPERVDWLEEAGVRRYKVASRSVRDRALLDRLTATGKPLLISLGQWGEAGWPLPPVPGRVDYLYCVSKYPTPLAEVGLAAVDFGVMAGFSDHTIGITAACVAMARGARVIEKHFTLDQSLDGPDHQGSMTPTELKALDQFRREAALCLT